MNIIIKEKTIGKIFLVISLSSLTLLSLTTGYNLSTYHEKNDGNGCFVECTQYCFTGMFNDEHCSYDYGFSEAGTMVGRFALSITFLIFEILVIFVMQNEKHHWIGVKIVQ